MKNLLFIILDSILFVSCANQLQNFSDANKNQNHIIYGKWESPRTRKTVLTFDKNNLVNVVIPYLYNEKPVTFKYEYNIFDDKSAYIDYPTNGKVKRIEANVIGNKLILRCIYKEPPPLNTPVPVDFSDEDLCTINEFNKVEE